MRQMLAAHEFTAVGNFGRRRCGTDANAAAMSRLSCISPQHIHRRANEDFELIANACCAQIHGWGQLRARGISVRSISVLVHGGATGRAEIALLPHQAGGDGADIRDFAGAEAVNVRRAGAALLRRALRNGRTGGDKCQRNPERCGDALGGRKGSLSWAHGRQFLQ